MPKPEVVPSARPLVSAHFRRIELLQRKRLVAEHAFGDDGKTLYIVGGRDVYRIRLKVDGRFFK